MDELIKNLSKAELHIHIEGSLEPQMLLDLAKKNATLLKYKNIDEVKSAYKFKNLQEFLDLYYLGMSVLVTEDDFYNLTIAYLEKAHNNNITHAEIFFGPQVHLGHGVKFVTIINGIHRATLEATNKFNLEANLIICFLRDLPEKSALEALELALPYRDKFIGIGLDSTEIGNPPGKFKRTFELARNEGLHLVAHAGEEGPCEYIWEAIDVLGVERIDHGNKAIEDRTLVNRLVKDKIGLTMCPLSNLALHIVSDLKYHPAKALLDAGVLVSINSDDPAYFGGYINENYLQLANSQHLTASEIKQFAANSSAMKFV